jgi:dephospho-CoA kinase
MRVIGLIGGIGSGKSQVANLLKQRGASVIDADAVGHDVLEEPEVRREIVERFGKSLLRPDAQVRPGDGLIDRHLLASVVFSDRAALRDLERILHPRMRRHFASIIERERASGQVWAVVLDAAVLLETGWDELCDVVVFVDASVPVRLKRVSHSRGWDAEALHTREAAQWSCDFKRNRANVVLVNDSDLESLEREVDRFCTQMLGGNAPGALPPNEPQTSPTAAAQTADAVPASPS